MYVVLYFLFGRWWVYGHTDSQRNADAVMEGIRSNKIPATSVFLANPEAE